MTHNSHLVQLSKAPVVRLHRNEAAKRLLREGETVSISANGALISAKLKLDSQVAEGALVLPLGFPELPVQDLGLFAMNGQAIEINPVSHSRCVFSMILGNLFGDFTAILPHPYLDLIWVSE